ncbi:unnamed protein product [Didymodactylos carnosus]|uniref:Uncharacterized protein n=1 Tax=Didymodactylos carnosus TaxID=1234261 RepID=A0A8S2FUX6_9BILA|nr:unnamed protein product [Didymodactylos carnosus]CAF4361350.1 unnamed protein product [Didymodactylos carnosus]
MYGGGVAQFNRYPVGPGYAPGYGGGGLLGGVERGLGVGRYGHLGGLPYPGSAVSGVDQAFGLGPYRGY